MKITIIGGGNMGGAIALGLSQSAAWAGAEITLVNRREARSCEWRERQPSLRVATLDYSSVREADVVVVAVKPWDVEALLTGQVAPLVAEGGQVLVSVAAGVSVDELAAWSGGRLTPFVAIPNTPIEVGQSMTYVVASPQATDAQRRLVEQLFGALGHMAFVTERQLPAAMALCSCGVAYALRYVRAAMSGGVELGLTPAQARAGVLQTLRGVVELLEAHGTHPEEEIDKVTTAGGLTIRGLNEMEHACFTSAVIRGLKASLGD